MTPTVEEFLAPFPPQTQALAQQVRQLIKETCPHLKETVRPGRNAITYEAGERMSEWLLYISPFKGHVNLGFFTGTSLPDPQGLLQGTGKSLRHVKIKQLEDVQNPALRELLRAAAQA